MGECETRTQGASIAALWARLRTQDRAAQRGRAARASFRKEPLSIRGSGCHVDDLADERRLLLALDLDLDADVPDHAWPASLGAEQLSVQADARARWHGARETSLLRPVVDAH